MLAGGGARGAYEAGALSVLLPALDRIGERPTSMVGTSVGSINAAYLAASRQLDPEEAAAGGIERWRDVRKGRVVKPILTWQAPITAVRYAGEILGLPGVRLPSLLDPAPLESNLPRWISWRDLHRNVREGAVESISVVATAARSGRTVVFSEGRERPAAPRHSSHVIDYVPARLSDQHLRASASIPILFPPVRVDTPRAARGWYFDGGTRLNTPIKPALDLGVDKLVVVGTDAISELPREAGRHDCDPPDFGDGALHVLQGMLVDPLIEDLRMLGNVNLFFGDGDEASAASAYRAARGKPPYRTVPYIFVGPERRGEIGELAIEVFRDRYGGMKGIRSPDFPLLSRLLGGESPTHGELLSYLFFDTVFIEELIAMGRRDARRWLDAPPGPAEPWQVEPLDAFTRPSAAPQTRPTRPAGRRG